MILSFCVGLALLYVATLLVISWVSLHPVRTPIFIAPQQFGAPTEDVAFESQDGRLGGWWIEAPGCKSVAICAHGYVMSRAELVPEALLLWKEGMSCLLFDFRAHGRSQGRRCSMGYREREDLKAAVRYARERAPGAKILVLGSSMGAAAAALALGDEPELLDALVLDSSYSRLTDAILGWWRFLGGEKLRVLLSPTVFVAWPLAGFNPFRVDVSEALRRTEVPLLFMHGTRDGLARPAEAQRNFEAARGPKKMVWFEGCNHSEGRWEQTEKYRAELLGFLREHALL